MAPAQTPHHDPPRQRDTRRGRPVGARESHAPPPRPRGPISLVVLAVLAVGYTLWASQALILPVLLAMFFALVGNPILRVLRRLHIPASSARWRC